MSKPPITPQNSPEAEAEAMKKLAQLRGKKLDTEHGLGAITHIDPMRQIKQDLERRRGRAVYETARPLSKTMYKTVYPQLRGKDSGAALSSLRRRWPEILGVDMAALCEPVQILKPTTGYVLVLEVNSAAAALKLKHQTDIILERVNAGSGARFKGIRLQQTKTKHASVKPQTKLKHRLTPQEAAQIEAELADVESPIVRKALQKLGEAIRIKQETLNAARKAKASASPARRVRSFKSR
ncbi:DUF721 domain-containing protein [Hirschia litorea]|uniref:DUF721 domain-containing protein n=1 Tax=Hirschia litorea TaxID=1199156 RepID=A0ABW2IJ08_9PROT